MFTAIRTALRARGIRLVLGAGLTFCAGCTTPESRLHERPAALQDLSPADRNLALTGHVRDGFGKDAVYVAWGAPSNVHTMVIDRQPLSYWLYSHVEHGAGGGFFGITRGFRYHGRYIVPHFPGPGTDDFYLAPPYSRGLPPPETEVPYKKVVFEGDRAISHDSARGGSTGD